MASPTTSPCPSGAGAVKDAAGGGAGRRVRHPAQRRRSLTGGRRRASRCVQPARFAIVHEKRDGESSQGAARSRRSRTYSVGSRACDTLRPCSDVGPMTSTYPNGGHSVRPRRAPVQGRVRLSLDHGVGSRTGVAPPYGRLDPCGPFICTPMSHPTVAARIQARPGGKLGPPQETQTGPHRSAAWLIGLPTRVPSDRRRR
jgi:hypothetical protein